MQIPNTPFKNTEEIIDFFQAYLETLGIKSFAFTYYSFNPSSLKKCKYEYASPSIRKWHEYYLEAGYEDNDETLRWSRQAVLPVYWDLTDQLQTAKTEKEIILRKESIIFGIESGLSIPIHGPENDFATLTLYQLKKQKQWNKNNLIELTGIAYFIFGKIREKINLILAKENKYQLTKRELQCLQLTAKNLIAEDIAKITSMSTRTVHFHLQNVNKKMGVKTKFHAVIKALQENLLNDK